MIAACPLSDGDHVVLSGAAGKIRGSVVRVFTTDTIAAPTEAPTIRNLAHTLLSSRGVDRAALLVVGRMTPFFLVEDRGCWYDVAGCPIIVTPVDPACPNES